MKTPSITLAAMLVTTATAVWGVEPVVQVYPSGPAVPENLLRIELHFSVPLQPPLTLDQVKLLDEHGLEIAEPFLDMPLPSRDGKRLSILLHPGRVKSGVGANLVLGRALHAGATVTLQVDHPALATPVRKRWQVTAFDAQPPQPKHWTWALPPTGSQADLILQLDKPISSTAGQLIAIRGPDGNRLAGEARLENGETVWRFTPARPWQAGQYAVVTHPDLEDCAGNRPGAPFESIAVGRIHDTAGTAQPFALASDLPSPKKDSAGTCPLGEKNSHY